MKSTVIIPLAILAFTASVSESRAQYVFFAGINGGDGITFEDPGNWQGNLVPASGNSDLSFSHVLPSLDNLIQITNAGVFSANSLTISTLTDASLSSPGMTSFQIGAGGLNNLSGEVFTFNVSVIAGANAFWDGGSGITTADGLALSSHTIDYTGTINLNGETSLVVDSPAFFGSLTGSGTLNAGGTLSIDFNNPVQTGDSFNLFSGLSIVGAFTGIDFFGNYLGSILPDVETEVDGLKWLYESSTGTLSVVPEPSALTMTATAALISLFTRRRRSRME